MSSLRKFLVGIPALLVGAAGASVAEMSASLLLYSTEGFLPALTLILTVETGALALGLWSGSIPSDQGVVETLRKRWFFTLVSFALAAIFAAGFTLRGDLFTGGNLRCTARRSHAVFVASACGLCSSL